jgi:hypothetical protein
MASLRTLRTTLVALSGILATACSFIVPPPTPADSRTPTTDELISLYDAEGVDCEEGEYPSNSFFSGTFVSCSEIVGDARLLVEARYGDDEELDRANHALIPVGYPEDQTLTRPNGASAMELVLRIPYAEADAVEADAERIRALADPDCLGEDCVFEVDGGHWTLRRARHGGWWFDLSLDRVED